jgi:hypothetical protein
MSIHDFHSKLSSRNEHNVLFEALRQLRRIDDVRSLLFEETTLGGWNPWSDAVEPPAVGA